MEYQSHTAPLARPRTESESFTAGLAFTARRMLFGATHLTPSERQLLHDLSRSESRYAMKTLQTLIAIAPRCAKVEDQEALPEFIRGRIARQRAQLCDPFTAFAVETEAQGLTDIAQYKYARRPSAITKAEVLEALRRQESVTRLSIDALLTTAA
jgi:hypothetical protein